MTKALEINDLITLDEDQQIITNGEAAILQKLEALQDQLEELTQKVDDLVLTANSGLSIETY